MVKQFTNYIDQQAFECLLENDGIAFRELENYKVEVLK